MAVSRTQTIPGYWPSARYFTEAIQCPSVCFAHPVLRDTLPAVDRLGMPLVTSGQFAYVYKLNSMNGDGNFAVRCFRGYLGDRDQRYRAIQEHLRSSPAPYLSDFTYASEGILVGGNRFPILFMKWIDGPTLDLYLSELLDRPDVLLHLSEEWLKLVSALKAAGVAHGDLQHGNIIVEHGQLRLVDHDGIFVPRMAGWTASEIGHQHYQHPRRDARHFDAELDNFSSLVIYLSLSALAERPDLWAEYHDENLLFTKADFADPTSSGLFRQVRELGPEHSRLADVLAAAATGEPTDVPCLLDLVKSRATLPSWMTTPADLDGTTRTREVVPPEPVFQKEPVRWTAWGERGNEPFVPTTPASTSVQTIFGSAPPLSSVQTIFRSAPTLASALDPSDVRGNTMFFAREFARKYFVWWYWGMYLALFEISGLGLALSLAIALVLLSAVCLSFGLAGAIDVARKAKRIRLSGPQAAIAPPPAPQPGPTGSWDANANLPPSATGGANPFVGNLVLGIFHLENCAWVERISAKNRVTFSTPAEAQSHGFKPCRICSPAT